MEDKGDTNKPPSEDKNQVKILKVVMSASNSSSSEETIFSDNQLTEARLGTLTEDDFDDGLKIVIISDDEDAEIEPISDISNPSYDPRRYYSYKFRQSPTRMDSDPKETNTEARYCEIEPTEKYNCVDESTTHSLNFATRYPNYLRDFKFINYPPLEDVSPPEFQLSRPHYTIDIENDFNNFTPWRQRAEREELLASSSNEVKVIDLEDFDTATESQNLLEKGVSEIQFSSNTRPYYQEPSTLISLRNVSSEGQICNREDRHEYVNLNKMQRGVTFNSVYQSPEPLPCYSTDEEAWEYIRVSDTDQSSDENQYSDLEKLVHPPPIKKFTEDRPEHAPLLYEDFKEPMYGPKPQYWIDFQEAGEIGKTVAIFDKRDFRYNNKNIKPVWIDEEFDFHAPIRGDFHEFSKVFMANIPFYDNESEEIQKFARQYKKLRASLKYNIQEPVPKKKPDSNLQKEPKQNDSINDTSASRTQISEFEGTMKTEVKPDQDATIATEKKTENETGTPERNEVQMPLRSSQLKSVLKPPRRENLTATDDGGFEKRVYYRSDIDASIKRVTFKLDENNEERVNKSDVSQNAQFHTEVSMPTKILILEREKVSEENIDNSDMSKSTQFSTGVSMSTNRNEEAMTERNAKSDVSKNVQPHAGVLTLTSKTVQSLTDISVSKQQDEKSAVKIKKPEFYMKYSELNKQQFKTTLKQQTENIPEKNDENLLVTKKRKKKNKSPNTSKSKVDDVVGKNGKASESGNTKANNKADKANQNSKSKQGNQQKHQRARQ